MIDWIKLAEEYEQEAEQLEENIRRKEAIVADHTQPLSHRVKAGQILSSLRSMRIDVLCTARTMRENARYLEERKKETG